MKNKRKNAARDSRWLIEWQATGYSPAYIGAQAIKYGISRDTVLSAIRRERKRKGEVEKRT